MNTDIQDVYHKTRPNFSYMKDQNLLRKILKETSYNNKQSKIQTRNEIFQGGYINYRDLQKIGGSITNNFSNLTDNIDRRVNVNINIPTTGLGKRYHRLENIRNYGNPLSMDPELENDKDDYLEEISKNKKTQRFRRYLEHRKNYQVPQITLHTEYELKPKKESEERFGLTTFREENNSGNYPEEVPVLSEPIVGNKFEEKREYPNISSQWNKRFVSGKFVHGSTL